MHHFNHFDQIAVGGYNKTPDFTNSSALSPLTGGLGRRFWNDSVAGGKGRDNLVRDEVEGALRLTSRNVLQLIGMVSPAMVDRYCATAACRAEAAMFEQCIFSSGRPSSAVAIF